MLAVDVQPWAEVILDGKVKGHTPLQTVLSPGRHTIELRNQAASYSKRFTLTFRKGTKTKLMDAAQ